ncbi:hypothetical protein NUSPORA_02718 [Nucleospora cyclopteri]
MIRNLSFYIDHNNINLNANIGLKHVINFFLNNMLNGYFLRLSNMIVTFIRTNINIIDINSLSKVVADDFHLVNKAFYIFINPLFDLLPTDTTNVILIVLN